MRLLVMCNKVEWDESVYDMEIIMDKSVMTRITHAHRCDLYKYYINCVHPISTSQYVKTSTNARTTTLSIVSNMHTLSLAYHGRTMVWANKLARLPNIPAFRITYWWCTSINKLIIREITGTLSPIDVRRNYKLCRQRATDSIIEWVFGCICC